jgi:hypothetical protein
LTWKLSNEIESEFSFFHNQSINISIIFICQQFVLN